MDKTSQELMEERDAIKQRMALLAIEVKSLNDKIRKAKMRELTLDNSSMLNLILVQTHDSTLNKLNTRGKGTAQVVIRKAAAYLLIIDMGCTYEQAGLVLERTHDTILNHVKKHKADMRSFKLYNETYTKMTEAYDKLIG